MSSPISAASVRATSGQAFVDLLDRFNRRTQYGVDLGDLAIQSVGASQVKLAGLLDGGLEFLASGGGLHFIVDRHGQTVLTQEKGG